MLQGILRIGAEMGPGALWVLVLWAAIAVVFAGYIGIAVIVTLRTKDPDRRQAGLAVLDKLTELFGGRRYEPMRRRGRG